MTSKGYSSGSTSTVGMPVTRHPPCRFPRRFTGRILLKHDLAAVKREISEPVLWPLELDVKSYDVTVELKALLHVRNV
jgi:hypothetical protein